MKKHENQDLRKPVRNPPKWGPLEARHRATRLLLVTLRAITLLIFHLQTSRSVILDRNGENLLFRASRAFPGDTSGSTSGSASGSASGSMSGSMSGSTSGGTSGGTSGSSSGSTSGSPPPPLPPGPMGYAEYLKPVGWGRHVLFVPH